MAASCTVCPDLATTPEVQHRLDAKRELKKPMYETHGASCHGADMKGTDVGLPSLHKIYESSHHGDAAFQLAVASGVRAPHGDFGDMAPVPGVSPDDVAHITDYIRALQRRAGIK